jgi:hypothetical protein
MYAAPALPGSDHVVAKVVVTTAFPLALHQERFRPDRTILFLRHPGANYRSLAGKKYRHHCGFIEEKFAVLDRVFIDADSYDLVIYYEDLIFSPRDVLSTVSALGWPVKNEFLNFARTPGQIKSFNGQKYPMLADRLEYDIGNYHRGPVTAEFADLTDLPDPDCPTSEWCPEVTGNYCALMQENYLKWRATPSNEGNPEEIHVVAKLNQTGLGEQRVTQSWIDAVRQWLRW